MQYSEAWDKRDQQVIVFACVSVMGRWVGQTAAVN